MMLDREQESLALSLELTDPAIALVAAARAAEAAHVTFIAGGGEEPDTADDAIFDALEDVPTTLEGVRAKIEMGLEIEGVNWPADAVTLFRSLLASPILPVGLSGKNMTYR